MPRERRGRGPRRGEPARAGGHLLALKALLPRYAGQVKCIYIDPPYNTGNESWVYNDNVNSPVIREWLGKAVGREAEDFSRHDKWLCMMYPRLKLLREFLRDDGAIFVSLDDNEVASLRMLMDEILGAENFVASIIWEKADSPRNSARQFSTDHDYILVYSKYPDWIPNRLPRTDEANSIYRNPDNDPRGVWLPGDPYANKPYSKGQYTLTGPTGRTFSPPGGRFWRVSEEKLRELDNEGRIWWGPNKSARPSIKRYLTEVGDLVPRTLWTKEQVGSNRTSKNEMRDVFANAEAFATPKPTKLLERILQLAVSPGDLILDSFAGSGTTGHAVLQMNQQDGGDRRFILVEMEPPIARDITAERLRRVASGYTRADGTAVPGLGDGFRYLELGEPMFDPATGQIHPAVTFADLARHVWFTATREPAPERPDGPLLGVSRAGVGVYLLFNGILGDRSARGGNVLTARVLAALPPHDGPRVVYATGCRLDDARLRELGVTFKQIPYDLTGAAT